VFGELFYALEPDYRGKKGQVRTQYASLRGDSDNHDSQFYVPENVFIIGTMNDIDRSVVSMDFALRRRFVWYEIQADLPRFDTVMNGVLADKPDLKEEAKTRYEKLNHRIGEDQGLGPAYKIGPAYFRKLEKYKAESEEDIWENFWRRHLEPLIREYVRGMPDEKDRVAKFKDGYLLKQELPAQS
jgi:5-methylcytosine-specific restriction protein B